MVIITMCKLRTKRKNTLKYIEHEGMLLEEAFIHINSGLRSLPKLSLNSFNGKCGQRTNMKETKVVTGVGILYNLFMDPSKQAFIL